VKEEYLWDIYNPLGYGNRSGRYKTIRQMEFINKHLSSDCESILDLGGGSGRFSILLHEKGYKITVVDLNERAIELCKERSLEDSHCMDFRSFDRVDYDMVIAIDLFTITPPEDVFQAAYKHLKYQGVFIFSASNKMSWRYKLHLMKKSKTLNLGEYSLKQFQELIEHNSFSIKDIMGFFWIPFEGQSNNRMIPFFAFIERKLQLNKWLKQSPLLMFACIKD